MLALSTPDHRTVGAGARLAALLLVVLATLGTAAARSAAATEPGPIYYVSLGDSLAAGRQPGPDGHDQSTRRGYVDAVAASLQRRQPRLHPIRLGCRGTTSSVLSGPNCTSAYGRGSQLAQAVRFLRAHRQQTLLVTINIGDNDFEGCLYGGTVPSGCLDRTTSRLQRQLRHIALDLHYAAGRAVPIVGLTDYDQFLAYWRGGQHDFARQSASVVMRVNRAMDNVYRRSGAIAADAAGAFWTGDFRPVHYHGHRLPHAVATICALTWACTSSRDFDDHANDRGYRLLGSVILRALRRAGHGALVG